MKHLTRAEFATRFVRRSPSKDFSAVYHRDLHVDGDATISGVVEGSLFIHGDAHVLMIGVVNGSVHVDRGAVLWIEGLVDGRVHVVGAAVLNGTNGSVRAHGDAIVHDPCEPADSEMQSSIG